MTAFSQADGFLAIDALASALDAGSDAAVTLIGRTRMPDLVIMGSHCVALDAVLGRLADQGFAARTIAIGSQGGVTAAERGECDLAPVHLLDPAGETYNRHLVRPGIALVPGWRRMQGFVFRAGDARFAGKTAAQALAAALADPDCLMVNRNAGAGTRILIDRLLDGKRPAGYANQPQVAQCGRGRGRAGPRRLGHRDRARWRGSTAWSSCPSRRSTMISCWLRADESARPCRRSWRRCAIPRCARGSRALGMVPADE